ncbi:hypothetical protein [Cellvibrio mixtus]|uniref:hypothetical protein n=1 Tax=Cellvibrio mixtus TaxID=39650 RepID=UPI00069349E7|nr:hypothetical protein [Cellvibrio mixtus]
MRVVLVILGALLFIASVKLGYCLLSNGKLSGSEFISLIIAFAIIGLIISFASEVSEFSIAGNIVKLKEVKADAERSIAELKEARTETFRFLLSLTKKYGGGLGSIRNPIDERIPDFWSLFEKISSFSCVNDLKKNIMEVIDVLLKGQIKAISKFNNNVETKYRGEYEFPTPVALSHDSLQEQHLQEAAGRIFQGDLYKTRGAVLAGLEEYRKLFELKNKLS